MELSRKNRHQKRKREAGRARGIIFSLLKSLLPVFSLLLIIVMIWIYAVGGLSEGENNHSTASSDSTVGKHEEPTQNQDDEDAAVVPSEESTDTQDTNDLDPDAVEESPAAETPSNTDQVSFAFVGDILLGSRVDTLMQEKGYDYPYAETKPWLQAADVTVGNLENPITERGTAQDKEYTFRASPLTAPELKNAGFDVLNLANNHMLDFGLEGMYDTIDVLTQEEIAYAGAGDNDEEAFAPVYLERNGVKIAFIGLTRVVPDVSWKADRNIPGVAETYNYERAVASIEKANEEADLVVVMVHWGKEKATEPNEQQIELGQRYIDAGADLVVGHHPHVLQGIEQYKGKWIAYSLGNFIFTSSTNSKTSDSAILQAACTKDGECQLTVVPVKIQAAQPAVLEREEARKQLDDLASISRGIVIEDDGLIVPIEAVNP